MAAQHIANPGLALSVTLFCLVGRKNSTRCSRRDIRKGEREEKKKILLATECLQCQVMALGVPLKGRFFYSLIHLIGDIWEGQPSRKPAFSGDLSRVLGGTGIKIVNLSPLLPKQNIWGRIPHPATPRHPASPRARASGEREREISRFCLWEDWWNMAPSTTTRS